MSDKPPPQRTWGGRFGDGPAALMREINASIRFDKRLWREDIAASKAHAAMLRDQGIIGEATRRRSSKGSTGSPAEYERDGVPESAELEDIHMTVEHRLAELIGEAAGRLHTARSRNDQVATDFRLWVRKPATKRPTRSAACSASWSSAPRSMPTRSCPASRICRSRSR